MAEDKSLDDLIANALYHKKQHEFSKAERLLQKLLKRLEALEEVDQQIVFSTLSELADVYRIRGKKKQADKLYDRALALAPDAKPLPERLLKLLIGVAINRCDRGDVAAAEKFYSRAHALAEEWTDPGSEERLSASLVLARIFEEQGRYQSLIPFLEKQLQTQESTVGKKDPSTAETHKRLGMAHRRLRNYKVAEQHLKLALDAVERKRGYNHLDVALLLCELAALYRETDHNGVSQQMLDRATAISMNNGHKNTPEVATVLYERGCTSYSQFKYAEALELFLKSLQIRKATLGKESNESADCLISIGMCNYSLKRFEATEAPLIEALIIKRKIRGPYDREVGSILNKLAGVYKVQRRFVEATLLLEQVEIIQGKLANMSPEYEYQRNIRVALLAMQDGKLAKAERCLQRAINDMRSWSTPENPELISTHLWMYELQRMLMRYEVSEQHLQYAEQGFKECFGCQHADMTFSAQVLANIFQIQSKPQFAEPFYRYAVTLAERNGEPGRLLDLLDGYARLLEEDNRELDAKRVRMKMRSIKKANRPKKVKSQSQSSVS